MQNNLLSTALVATLLIGFSGCTPQVAVPVQVKTGGEKSLNAKYIFNDTLSEIKITKNELMDALSAQAKKGGTTVKDSAQFGLSSKWQSRIYGENWYKYYGRDIHIRNDKLNIYYIDGIAKNSNDLYNLNLKECERSIGAFQIPLIVKGEKDFELSSTYPSVFTSIECDSPLFFPAERIGRDSLAIFETLSSVSIPREYNLEGEIDTQFPDKSIYANFKRKLGNYSWGYSNEHITDIKKENTFSLKIRGSDYPLYIEIYPYRSGSKVKYSTRIAYSLDSNGGSTLTKSEIEALRKEIASVIND